MLYTEIKANLPRVCFISPHPAPYRDPVLVELAQRRDIELHVFILFPLDVGHKEWNYSKPQYPCVDGVGIFNREKDAFHPNLMAALIRGNYSFVVAPGLARMTSFAAVMYCWMRSIPFALAIDSVEDGPNSSKSGLLKRVTALIRSKAAAFWVPGYASANYLQSKNIASEKIFRGMYCLDGRDFLQKIPDRVKNREIIERDYSISADAIVLLAIGKLLSFRRYDLLIQALAEIAPRGEIDGQQIRLLLIGEGAEMQRLQALKNSLQSDAVIFCGAKPLATLPLYYSAADIFVHPGAEPFSTATEYAAICGLAVVASQKVGYAVDLKAHGGELVEFTEGCSPSLGAAIHQIILRIRAGQDIGAVNAVAAEQRSVRRMTDNFIDMVNFATKQPQ